MKLLGFEVDLGNNSLGNERRSIPFALSTERTLTVSHEPHDASLNVSGRPQWKMFRMEIAPSKG